MKLSVFDDQTCMKAGESPQLREWNSEHLGKEWRVIKCCTLQCIAHCTYDKLCCPLDDTRLMNDPGWLEMPEKTISFSTLHLSPAAIQWVTGIHSLPRPSWYIYASVATETSHFCKNMKSLGQRLAKKIGIWTWVCQSILVDADYFSSDHHNGFTIHCFSFFNAWWEWEQITY